MDEEEFRPILRTVADFVDEVVIPAENEIEVSDKIPEQLRRSAARMGLFGYALPVEYGGLNLRMAEEVRLAFILGRAAPAFRSMFGTNNGIAGQVLVNDGTPEQKRKYLPSLASGESIASFALTEPDAGSSLANLRTKAVETEGSYVISGEKRYITNAPQADLFITFARTGDTNAGTQELSAFIVDSSLEGVSVGPADEKMGQRGAQTATVHFDDVHVDADCLIGEVAGEGFQSAMRSLVRGRIHIAALCVGMAERLIQEMVAHATTQTQGGVAIGNHQLVQAMLADSWTEALAARAMVEEAAELYDTDADRQIAPSAAKLFCSEMVGRVADRAVQVFGGMGYMKSTTVERCYRDARLFRLYEGTSEMQRVNIAKHMIKAHAATGGKRRSEPVT